RPDVLATDGAEVLLQAAGPAIRGDQPDVQVVRRVGAVPGRLEGDRGPIRGDDRALELLADGQRDVEAAEFAGRPGRLVGNRRVDRLGDDRLLALRALLLRVGDAARRE